MTSSHGFFIFSLFCNLSTFFKSYNLTRFFGKVQKFFCLQMRYNFFCLKAILRGVTVWNYDIISFTVSEEKWFKIPKWAFLKSLYLSNHLTHRDATYLFENLFTCSKTLIIQLLSRQVVFALKKWVKL